MFNNLLRKSFSPVCSRHGPVLLLLSCSDSAVARNLPKLKALTDRDCSRESVLKFKENFIENLFINRFQEDVLEYPQIDSLEDLDDLRKHFFLAQKLITGISESAELSPLGRESKNSVVMLKNFELIGFKQPRIKNGFGYLQSEYTFLQEALTLDPSLSKTVTEFEEFGVQLLSSFGNELQKEQYLDKLVRGEVTACLAYVESESIVSFETDSLNTSASFSPDTQSYVISGTKVWVYNAENSDLFILLANVTSDGREEELKPTLFLIDKNVPGVDIHKPIKTVGLNNLKISNVSFNNVVVSQSSVLGDVSEGFAIINKILSQGKLNNGGQCLTLMRKFTNKAIEHCIGNEFFGKDKNECNYFRKKVGKMVSQLYIVESMTYLLTGRLDCHKNADVFLESLIVKIFASETLQYILQETVEILGSEFFTSDDNLVELSRDSQFYAACDDANSQLRLILSTAGLKHAIKYKKEKTFQEMIQEIFSKQSLLKLALNNNLLHVTEVLKGYVHPMFSDESLMLEDCVYSLSRCTNYLIDTYGENVFERHNELQYLADIVIDIYALLATMARASRAYCICVKFHEFDRRVVDCEARTIVHRVRRARDFILQSKNKNSNYTEIGSHVIGSKNPECYPILRNLMFCWRSLIRTSTITENGQTLFRKTEILLTAKQQHLQFQAYLKKEKAEVTKNLKKKIFPNTNVEDYNFLQILGHGSYGIVAAAENINDNRLFAVKIIKKKKLVRREHLSHLISEIRILNSVKFEFLISLECYFTNKCCIFLVMPLIKGGNLYKLLRKVQRLEEHEAKFFAGQIILAIEYLHYMGIVYRDLKPENLLLDVQGYLKLVDFGFSKTIGHNYSYTFCGTPEYIAPEILLSKGYSLSPDWWALGILLFEMCNGAPPFLSRNELKLFEKILSGKIEWPVHFSKDFKSLVQGLLQVDKSKRLGCTKGKVEEIKYHSWFFNFDWMGIWNKTILSPISYNRTENEIDEIHMNSSLLKCQTVIPSDLIGNIDFVI